VPTVITSPSCVVIAAPTCRPISALRSAAAYARYIACSSRVGGTKGSSKISWTTRPSVCFSRVGDRASTKKSEHKLGVSYGRVSHRTGRRRTKANTCSTLHRTDLSIARRRRFDWATPRRADDFSVRQSPGGVAGHGHTVIGLVERRGPAPRCAVARRRPRSTTSRRGHSYSNAQPMSIPLLSRQTRASSSTLG
jgi:hypothetical protein